VHLVERERNGDTSINGCALKKVRMDGKRPTKKGQNDGPLGLLSAREKSDPSKGKEKGVPRVSIEAGGGTWEKRN